MTQRQCPVGNAAMCQILLDELQRVKFTLLVKPSSVGKFFGKPLKQPCQRDAAGLNFACLELDPEEVEAFFSLADEGFVRMGPEAKCGERLVHDTHGAAQLPAAGTEDDPVIHVAEVSHTGDRADGAIKGGQVNGCQ